MTISEVMQLITRERACTIIMITIQSSLRIGDFDISLIKIDIKMLENPITLRIYYINNPRLSCSLLYSFLLLQGGSPTTTADAESR